MNGNQINQVLAKNIKTGEELAFKAPLFADCTGDGTIGYLAGADYHMGREGRDEFGEPTAPETADKMTMGSSVQWYSIEEKEDSTFPLFVYGIKFNEDKRMPPFNRRNQLQARFEPDRHLLNHHNLAAWLDCQS